MKISNARLTEGWSGLEVDLEGFTFFAGEKYTFVEQGWGSYLSRDKLPEGWLRKYGETKPAEDDWSEMASEGNFLITSHPVLVALLVKANLQLEGEVEIETSPQIGIPDWDEAVEIVRNRKIWNDFNQPYADRMPGLERWSPDSDVPIV